MLTCSFKIFVNFSPSFAFWAHIKVCFISLISVELYHKIQVLLFERIKVPLTPQWERVPRPFFRCYRFTWPGRYLSLKIFNKSFFVIVVRIKIIYNSYLVIIFFIYVIFLRCRLMLLFNFQLRRSILWR